MNEGKSDRLWPGSVLAIAIGIAAWLISLVHTAVDSLVVGIVLGMTVRTIIGQRATLIPGLRKATNILIPIGIILYGTHLEFNRLVEVPTHVWLQLLVGITVIIIVVFAFGPMLKLTKPLSLLLGVGTAICGASAIVITAPVVEAKSEETAKSLVVITLLGLIGVILWPLLGRWLGLTDESYALFCATTLQQTGLVKTAAGIFGPYSQSVAMIIKMARITIIIPLILVTGILSKFKTADQAAESRKRLGIHIPWFLWAFILTGLIFSYITPLTNYTQDIQPLAGLVWTVALVSVGLNVDIKLIASSLGRPIILGLLAWIAAISVFLISAIPFP